MTARACSSISSVRTGVWVSTSYACSLNRVPDESPGRGLSSAIVGSDPSIMLRPLYIQLVLQCVPDLAAQPNRRRVFAHRLDVSREWEWILKRRLDSRGAPAHDHY